MHNSSCHGQGRSLSWLRWPPAWSLLDLPFGVIQAFQSNMQPAVPGTGSWSSPEYAKGPQHLQLAKANAQVSEITAASARNRSGEGIVFISCHAVLVHGDKHVCWCIGIP